MELEVESVPACFVPSASTHFAAGTVAFWKDYGTCPCCGKYVSVIRGEEHQCPSCGCPFA